jgi:hypothetical protein
MPRDTRRHTVEWIWQAAGEAAADENGGTLAGESEATTLSVSSPASLTTTTASGETDPYRGWGSAEETKEPHPLPTLRVQSGEWTGGIEAVSLLSPVDASLVGSSFGGETRQVDVEARDGRRSVTFEDASERVTSIGLESPHGDVDVSLDDHDLLATE